MIGSIIGDIVGSIYEFDNIKTKDFPLFQSRQEYTDDSILTLATADWLMNGGTSGSYYLRYALENPYPMGSYGTGFIPNGSLCIQRLNTQMVQRILSQVAIWYVQQPTQKRPKTEAR